MSEHGIPVSVTRYEPRHGPAGIVVTIHEPATQVGEAVKLAVLTELQASRVASTTLGWRLSDFRNVVRRLHQTGPLVFDISHCNRDGRDHLTNMLLRRLRELVGAHNVRVDREQRRDLPYQLGDRDW